MQRLYGKSILIGRDAQTSRLLFVVQGGGQSKAGIMGNPASVPGSVSRCLPAEGAGHCRIDVSGNGQLTITNLKSANVTRVGGAEVFTKRITPDREVTLGADNYRLPLAQLITAAQNLCGPVPEKPCNIRHLEDVYNQYHDALIEIQKRQRTQALLGRLPILFSMVGGLLSTLATSQNWSDSVRIICYLFTAISVLVMIYSMIVTKTDKSIEDREKVTEYLQDNYVCPKCGRYLPVTPYKLMKKQYQMKCPHPGCGAKYTE